MMPNTAIANPADEGVASATFEIPGLSSIPSGNGERGMQSHKVSITEVGLVAELEWVVVPKASTNAFLQVCLQVYCPWKGGGC